MNVEQVRGRVLIDTNVLIYATLSGDSRFSRAQEVMELRHREAVEVFISVQNLAEMYPNLTGPKNQVPDEPAVARAKICSISRLARVMVLPVTVETARLALELCEIHGVRRQRYFDMQLAALMLAEGIGTIITENVVDFEMVDGLKVLNPFE